MALLTLRIFQYLRYLLFAGLMISSAWFMKDVWIRFQSKDTAIKQRSDIRTELPTTVLCFDPTAKKSILREHNISMYEFSNMHNKQRYPRPWLDFYKKVHFRLGTDFYINIRDHPALAIGSNYINELNLTVNVEELFTFWFGFCYKISLSMVEIDVLIFNLIFDFKVVQSDLPDIEIILTSENNAFGVIASTWIFGNEFKIVVNEDQSSGFKIKATKKTSLGIHNNCTLNVTKNCLHEVISNSVYECDKICFPIIFSGMDSYDIPLCGSIEDYECMRWQMNKYLRYEASNICGTPCSIMEYVGKKSFGYKFYDNPYRNYYEWRYLFDSRMIDVHEEYLVYDSTGFIGSVGGTLGLFIGFSFREIVNLIIEALMLLADMID